MRGANFVSFFTVQGFFIGTVFAILKADSAEGILIYTFLITIFFYLFSHLCVAFYFRTITAGTSYFPKELHEHDLDLLVREINKREATINEAYEVTRAAAGMNSEDIEKVA